MERTSVRSSNLRSVGYNEVEQLLEIEFLSGGVYQYFNVPIEKYQSLMSASAHGTYFAAHIKNVYRYKKIH